MGAGWVPDGWLGYKMGDFMVFFRMFRGCQMWPGHSQCPQLLNLRSLQVYWLTYIYELDLYLVTTGHNNQVKLETFSGNLSHPESIKENIFYVTVLNVVLTKKMGLEQTKKPKIIVR